MALMKGALAGTALGAITLATIVFVAPIAAQAPGGGAGDSPAGVPGARGSDRPGAPGAAPGTGRRGETGPGADRSEMGAPGRRGFDPNDPDITGPRGGVGMCQERVTRIAQARLEHIQRIVRPTEEQRPAFEELRMAGNKAVDILRSACSGERPLTPPARMAAAEKSLEARLLAMKTLRPALDAFYRVLGDEQKIRWSTAAEYEGYGALGDRFGTGSIGRDRRGAGDPRDWDDRHGWRGRRGWGEDRRWGDRGWGGRDWGDQRGRDDERGWHGRGGFGWGERFGSDRDRWDDIERFGRRWRDDRGGERSGQGWRDDDRGERFGQRRRDADRDGWRDDRPSAQERERDQDRERGPRWRDQRNWPSTPDEERL